jgi:hypothetical protein
MGLVRRHLTYANVMATIAVFVVLGGGAYAAFHLPKNSVRSKNIAKGQVKKSDLAGGAVTAGKLKTPAHFTSAGFTDDPAGDCGGGSLSGWVNVDPANNYRVGYYRGPDGFVHLQGTTKPCDGHNVVIFNLPPGYRPARRTIQGIYQPPNPAYVEVFAKDLQSKFSFQAGDVYAFDFDDQLSLDGVSFRCGPSGQQGCP